MSAIIKGDHLLSCIRNEVHIRLRRKNIVLENQIFLVMSKKIIKDSNFLQSFNSTYQEINEKKAAPVRPSSRPPGDDIGFGPTALQVALGATVLLLLIIRLK